MKGNSQEKTVYILTKKLYLTQKHKIPMALTLKANHSEPMAYYQTLSTP